MDKIITNDGSITFYNKAYDECYHSRSGAEEEAVKKFIEPCKIKELALQPKIAILDIGFGLGYNVAAAIDCIMSVNDKCHIEIVSLEKDKDVFELIRPIDSNFKSYGMIKELVNKTELVNKNIKIRILLGDALSSIKTINASFDAVFLDPFSPKKNPELWGVDFFKDIKKLMKPKSIMATYSCARVVRDNMKKAGFKVLDGPIVGRRSPGTLAFFE